MITIGVDAHKRIHVAIALDEAGREVGTWRGHNSKAGWVALGDWAASLGQDRQIGIEGAWSYGRGLSQYLIGVGETVFEVNSRWTALGRQVARRRDKSDRLDARAVALFLWRESSGLTPLAEDDDTALLDLLSTERDDVIAEATRIRNQLHALLMQLDPEYKLSLPSMKSASGLARLRAYESPDDRPLSMERTRAVHRLAERLALVLGQAEELAVRIREIAARRFLPLTELCGINLLTAGALAGILGPGRRFASDAALAAYAGVAPLEASSAGRIRHRLNRGGNRRLNAIVYRVALTQAHYSPEARAYLARRVSEGKTRKEAVRALKRFIVRAIWQIWVSLPPHATPPAAWEDGAACT